MVRAPTHSATAHSDPSSIPASRSFLIPLPSLQPNTFLSSLHCPLKKKIQMGRGSPICEKCVKRLWNTLKTTFFNIKLQRLCKSHHLQCITSSRDSEKLEKSLRVRDKGRRPLLDARGSSGPQTTLQSLIGMILSLTLLNGPRNTSRNHCR